MTLLVQYQLHLSEITDTDFQSNHQCITDYTEIIKMANNGDFSYMYFKTETFLVSLILWYIQLEFTYSIYVYNVLHFCL